MNAAVPGVYGPGQSQPRDLGDGQRARIAELEQRINQALAINPADHATRSRDYGRGFADAITRTQAALRGDQ